MNIFQRLRETLTAQAVQASARVKTALRSFSSMFDRKEEIPKEEKVDLLARRQNAEIEAFKAAQWAIDNARRNPSDLIAQQAASKAQEYLSRSAALAGKGQLQDWNRLKMAERFTESGYASKKGQAAIASARLQTFNANFGFNLSASQYNTMRGMIHSPAFQKVLEANRNFYMDIYGMVGDQVEAGTDPVRIEQSLDLFAKGNVDNFEDFAEIVQLPEEDFHNLYTESVEMFESHYFQSGDDIARREAFEGLVGRYV